MRIGLFSDTYPPEINGVANSTYILKNELERNGHDVYVICTFKGIGEARWDGDHILRLAGMELKFLYGYVMTTPFHFHALELIKDLKLDVIHAQTEFGVGIFARMCAAQLKIPLVSTYHTTYEDYTHYVNFIHSKTFDSIAKKAVAKLSRLYGDSSMEVIAPSKKTKEMLEGYQVRREIDVIPTGLELDRFSPEHLDPEKTEQIRREFGFGTDDIVIVYVGRLAQEKALDIVIDGFAEAFRRGMELRLLIVGGGPDQKILEERVKELGLEKKIVVAGPRPNTEVPDIYRACNAFISASLSETQGMTFIEALASGIPLFARRDEVLKDLVIEDETGWYFNDRNDLPDLLEKFINTDPETLKQISENCLRKVEPYSSHIFYEKLMQVYERVIEEYRNQFEIDEAVISEHGVQLRLTAEGRKDVVVYVSIDEYYDKKLHQGVKLTANEVDDLIDHEKGLSAYQACMRRIAVKDRTVREISDWLHRKTECGEEEISDVIRKLKENGFLDDERYTRERVTMMKAALYGKDRIVRDLQMKGISMDIINEEMAGRMDDEEDNAAAFAKKAAASRKSDSVRKMKNMVRSRLIRQGYSAETANQAVEDLDTSEHEEKELENLRRTAGKAMRRYRKKYEGQQLENKVVVYCLSQGFGSDDIHAVLEEMRNEDEED